MVVARAQVRPWTTLDHHRGARLAKIGQHCRGLGIGVTKWPPVWFPAPKNQTAGNLMNWWRGYSSRQDQEPIG
jgi:hypothetical protein